VRGRIHRHPALSDEGIALIVDAPTDDERAVSSEKSLLVRHRVHRVDENRAGLVEQAHRFISG
jgi:hypothetical protein